MWAPSRRSYLCILSIQRSDLDAFMVVPPRAIGARFGIKFAFLFDEQISKKPKKCLAHGHFALSFILLGVSPFKEQCFRLL